MKRVLQNWFLIVMALCALPATAQEQQAIDDAKRAAATWLAQLDQGDYAGTWQKAAALFKGAVPQASWEQVARQAREPLGRLKSREVKAVTFTRSLPGVPDGEYVVIQYTSAFEKRASALETVTPMRDQDGTWRVSGYYVK